MSIESDFRAMVKLKEDAARLATAFADAQAALIAKMLAEKVEKVELGDAGEVKGTLVQGDNVVIDLDGLYETLKPAQQKLVTKVVIDKEKLEAAIALGKITAQEVTVFTEVKPKKPYLLVKGALAALPAADQPVNRNGAAAKRTVKVKGTVKKAVKP